MASVHSCLDMRLIPVNGNQLIGIQVSGSVEARQELTGRQLDVLLRRYGAIDIQHFSCEVKGIRQYRGNQVSVARVQPFRVSIKLV